MLKRRSRQAFGVFLTLGRGEVLSVFVLKLIAAVSMFIDHVAYTTRLAGLLDSRQLYTVARAIGRTAFVLFSFLLVNGFEKTHDRRKYLSRLILFAALSQIPFSLAFTISNYRGATGTVISLNSIRAAVLLLPLTVYYFMICERHLNLSFFSLFAAFLIASLRLSVGGICLLDENDLNVFYTLASALALIISLDYFQSAHPNWKRVVAILLASAVVLFFVQRKADYGLMGTALILGMFLFSGNKPLQFAFTAVWCLVEYRLMLPSLFGALSALIPIILYNGKLGPKLRTFFYLFYPVHLALLGVVLVFMSR